MCTCRYTLCELLPTTLYTCSSKQLSTICCTDMYLVFAYIYHDTVNTVTTLLLHVLTLHFAVLGVNLLLLDTNMVPRCELEGLGVVARHIVAGMVLRVLAIALHEPRLLLGRGSVRGGTVTSYTASTWYSLFRK